MRHSPSQPPYLIATNARAQIRLRLKPHLAPQEAWAYACLVSRPSFRDGKPATQHQRPTSTGSPKFTSHVNTSRIVKASLRSLNLPLALVRFWARLAQRPTSHTVEDPHQASLRPRMCAHLSAMGLGRPHGPRYLTTLLAKS